MLVFGLEGAYITFDRLRSDRLAAEAVVRNVGEPGSTFYFAGGPGENREFGRTDLVFDDWLYPVFESVHAAEPRSVWLRPRRLRMARSGLSSRRPIAHGWTASANR